MILTACKENDTAKVLDYDESSQTIFMQEASTYGMNDNEERETIATVKVSEKPKEVLVREGSLVRDMGFSNEGYDPDAEMIYAEDGLKNFIKKTKSLWDTDIQESYNIVPTLEENDNDTEPTPEEFASGRATYVELDNVKRAPLVTNIYATGDDTDSDQNSPVSPGTLTYDCTEEESMSTQNPITFKNSVIINAEGRVFAPMLGFGMGGGSSQPPETAPTPTITPINDGSLIYQNTNYLALENVILNSQLNITGGVYGTITNPSTIIGSNTDGSAGSYHNIWSIDSRSRTQQTNVANYNTSGEIYNTAGIYNTIEVTGYTVAHGGVITFNVDGTGQLMPSSTCGNVIIGSTKEWEKKQREVLMRSKLRANLLPHIKSRAALELNLPENEKIAMETLREEISETEFRKYLKYGFILVKGQSGDVYQIFKNKSHTKVWHGGKLIEEICVRIKYDQKVPPTDNVIAFKNIIETSEEGFKKLGNRYKMAA